MVYIVVLQQAFNRIKIKKSGKTLHPINFTFSNRNKYL